MRPLRRRWQRSCRARGRGDGCDQQRFDRSSMQGLNRLDILVNNAGIGLVGGIAQTEEADFDRLMKVNATRSTW